jgi:hypothetical protein
MSKLFNHLTIQPLTALLNRELLPDGRQVRELKGQEDNRIDVRNVKRENRAQRE